MLKLKSHLKPRAMLFRLSSVDLSNEVTEGLP